MSNPIRIISLATGLALLGTLMLGAGPAASQSQNPRAPTERAPETALHENTPDQPRSGALLKTYEPWQIDPELTGLYHGLDSNTCKLQATYQNGFRITLVPTGRDSGRLIVDVRQTAFEPGARFPVTLTVSDGRNAGLEARIHNTQMFSLPIDSIQDFNAVVRQNDSFTLDFGANRISFALENYDQAAAQQQKCLDRAVEFADLADMDQAQTGKPYNLFSTNSPGLSHGDYEPDATAIWAAQKGQTLRQVLQGWAAQAGIELVYNAQNDPELPWNFKVAGTLDYAVNTLLRSLELRTTGRMPQAKLENTL